MRDETRLMRKTKETNITITLNLYGSGIMEGGTGLRFFDHMIEQLVFYSGMDMRIEARWDLRHHLIEDAMFLLGKAISEQLGDREGIRRYGWAVVPMDESLVLTSIDLGGRTSYTSDLSFEGIVEGIDVRDISHGIEALARGSLSTIHIVVLRKGNSHHVLEAAFKSLGLSLGHAKVRTGEGIRSTKGVLDA